ncbi:hypothetical protein CCP2SC5_150006 [Azospirillaceae bacterium]
MGRDQLFGFPEEEASCLSRALQRCHPLETLEQLRQVAKQAAIIIFNHASLSESGVPDQIKEELTHGRRIAIATTPGQNEEPLDLRDKVATLERPLRPRHIRALLTTKERDVVLRPSCDARLAGLSILAAEDNKVNRLVLENMLHHEGAALVSCENGRSALERLKQLGASAFDIVITDIQMPEMDGYDLARSIASLPTPLPVIGLTAHAMKEERFRCLESGMVECIVKPINLDILVATILRRVKPKVDSVSSLPPPMIDVPKLKARYGDRQDFIVRLLATAASSHTKTPNDIRAAIRDNNLEQISRLAHTVKGTAGALAATELQSLAAQTERAARNADVSCLPLAERLAKAVEALRNEAAPESRTG